MKEASDAQLPVTSNDLASQVFKSPACPPKHLIRAPSVLKKQERRDSNAFTEYRPCVREEVCSECAMLEPSESEMKVKKRSLGVAAIP